MQDGYFGDAAKLMNGPIHPIQEEPINCSQDEGSSIGSGKLVNCHVNLNQAALWSMLRPLVLDIVQGVKQDERLASIEAKVSKLQQAVDRKADIKALRDSVVKIAEEEQRLDQMLMADHKLLLDLKANVAQIETDLSFKVEQAAMEETVSMLQRTNQAIASKVDLSNLNRTDARLSKLTQTVSQNEKMLQETAATLKMLDVKHLPQLAQRTKDMLTQTIGNVRKLQETIATKADLSMVEELAHVQKDLETALSWKANQQALLDVKTSVKETQRQVLLKADQLAVEDSRGDLHKLSQQVQQKVDHADHREVATSLHSLREALASKVDADHLRDAKSRLSSIEATIDKKADQHEVANMATSVQLLSERFALKADRHQVGELSQHLERLQSDLESKAEVHHVSEAHATVEQLQGEVQQLKQEANTSSLANHVSALDRRIESALEQLHQRLDGLGDGSSTSRPHLSPAASSASTAASAAIHGGSSSPRLLRGTSRAGAQGGGPAGARAPRTRTATSPRDVSER